MYISLPWTQRQPREITRLSAQDILRVIGGGGNLGQAANASAWESVFLGTEIVYFQSQCHERNLLMAFSSGCWVTGSSGTGGQPHLTCYQVQGAVLGSMGVQEGSGGGSKWEHRIKVGFLVWRNWVKMKCVDVESWAEVLRRTRPVELSVWRWTLVKLLSW